MRSEMMLRTASERAGLYGVSLKSVSVSSSIVPHTR